MPSLRRRSTLLLALLLGLAAGVAAAGRPGRDAPTDQPSGPAAAISEDAAVARVRDLSGGKVIRSRQKMAGDRLVYVVRVMLPGGRVRDYTVDAATGAVQ